MQQSFTEKQRDAVWAGLRLLQASLTNGRVKPDDGGIGDILTNAGRHEGLSAVEIHDLCLAFNLPAGSNEMVLPAVVLRMNGGAIHLVSSSFPLRVILLDGDTEGGDAEQVHEVDGDNVYVHDFNLIDSACGVEPAQVESVLRQVCAVEHIPAAPGSYVAKAD